MLCNGKIIFISIILLIIRPDCYFVFQKLTTVFETKINNSHCWERESKVHLAVLCVSESDTSFVFNQYNQGKVCVPFFLLFSLFILVSKTCLYVVFMKKTKAYGEEKLRINSEEFQEQEAWFGPHVSVPLFFLVRKICSVCEFQWW